MNEFALSQQRIPRKWLLFCFTAVAAMYALLWGPQWYPLSDSALYLAMGRSWAMGKGLTVQGHAVDLVPPIVPLMFGLIIKAGGGVGTIQGVLIAFLLAAHGLTFFALRGWVGERLALAGTVAGAMSYWVFYNACTIMTEPPAMAFAWGGIWALTRANLREPGGWTRSAVAAVLFLAAALSRDAAVLLLPGVAVVMWAQNRGVGWRKHVVWTAALCVMLGGLLTHRVAAKYQLRGDRDPFLLEKPPRDSDDGEEQLKALKVLHGVPRDWRFLTHPPMLFGRWVVEALVGPTVVIFNAKTNGIWAGGYAVGLAAAVLFLAGVMWWCRRGGWWAVIPLLYLLPIWGQWGARLKPRYMGLVAPLLLLVLAGGVVAIISWLWRRSDARTTRAAWTLTVLVMLGNLPAWLGEVYVRRQSLRDFYDVARQGASAALVDVAAYVQEHAGPDDTVWFNRGAERRVAHYLTGRRVLVRDVRIESWDDPAALARYLEKIPPVDRWAIIYVEQPVPGYTWPRWHWPVRREAKGRTFYRLMRRNASGNWEPVWTPVDREYVRSIPRTTQ